MYSPFKLNLPLGRSYNADLDDTLTAKRALKKLGLFETPSYGMTEYPDEPLFQGIEKFQERHGLIRDGVMKPDGETAKVLGQVLAEEGRNQARNIPPALALSAEVGLDRENRPHDILSVAEALKWAGFTAAAATTNDNDNPAGAVDEVIKRFQKSTGLGMDGWLRPYGETERALNRSLEPKVRDLSSSSNATDNTEDGTTTQSQQAALPVTFPAIAYKIAEFFGIAVMTAWTWWQSMSLQQREKIKKQISGFGPNGGDGDRDEQCDYLHYEVDIPKCNAVGRKYGKEAAQRCYHTANNRYAACRKGVPLNQLPPLDVWNH